MSAATIGKAPKSAIWLTTLMAGVCAGALTYWVWRRILGIPLELSTSIHMDDPTFPMRPWAPRWVAPFIVGLLVMGFWRPLVARQCGFSMKGSMIVMAAAVPVAFAVSFMCLNYGAMMQSPLVSFSKLVELTPLVVVEGVGGAAFFMMFNWILLLPMGVVGLVIAGIGWFCVKLGQQPQLITRVGELSAQQARTCFGRPANVTTAISVRAAAGKLWQLLKPAPMIACALGIVAITVGGFWLAHASYFSGPDVSESKAVAQDYTKAVKRYQRGAKRGNASDQVKLGLAYEKGRGVTQNYAEAVKWYRKAAEQGNALAQNNLAVMYSRGLGVEQDHEEALKWFRVAAEQGHPTAQLNLGNKYAHGVGVQQDYTEAAKWYREAAHRGSTAAQSKLKSMPAEVQK